MASDRAAGLSALEAAERLARDGPNELPSARQRRWWRLVLDVMREPMLLLLFAAGAINFILAEPLDGTLLMLTVVIIIGISLAQERKTERALIALRDLSAPRALVIRDGLRTRIPGREVVCGDVLILTEGDRVPADGLLLECSNLSVDESALTGESMPVRKHVPDQDALGEGSLYATGMGMPGGDGSPWVFSGTLVVKGRGIAVARATGSASQVGRIGTSLGSIEQGRTPLQQEIDRIVRVVAVAGIGAAAAVVVIYGLTRGNWLEGLLAGIATSMAMLPEEFPVVLTVFLALGAWRMSRARVLTRTSAVIETLGSATVICVDKTGTLTANAMSVRELIVDGHTHLMTMDPLPEEFTELARLGLLATPADPFDPMDRAFADLAQSGEIAIQDHGVSPRMIREYPLSDDLLALGQAWRFADDHRILIAAKGAPEAIEDLCRLPHQSRSTIKEQVVQATRNGQRVLAVAWSELDGELPDDLRAVDFTFAGLVGLQDPLRPGVRQAVLESRRAGVRVVMITGDYPGTAMAIARQAGLDVEGGYLTGADLDQMPDAVLRERVRDVNVFARMIPEQKLQLIRALKANGEVVGMTGDGVNDAPALRAAHIGIAMGARGTDVAREAAGLVITDDDFTSIVAGIRQGRNILDKLRKAMAYIVAVHVVIFGMSLIPVLGPSWPLVLLPLQIALLELIIDPACSIVFEAEEPDPQVMDRPPRGLDEPVLGRRILLLALMQGLGVLVAVLAVYAWALVNERDDEVVRSVTFGALLLGNLSLILVNRSWRLSILQSFKQRRNPALPWILAGGAVLLACALLIPAIRDALRLGAIDPADWLVIVIAGFAGAAWFEVYKWLRSR